jgi:hypothetical protein
VRSRSVVAHDHARPLGVGRAPEAAQQRPQDRRVAERGHDDGDAPPVLGVPAARRRRRIGHARGEAEPVPERGQPQREGDDAARDLPPAVVAVREQRAAREPREQPPQVSDAV